MTTWQRVPISSVYSGMWDGPHATPKPSESGAVYLGIRNITEDGHLDLSEIRYIADEDLPKWTKRVKPSAGDIVFTYEAALNRYPIIPQGFRGCLGRRTALIRPDPKKAGGKFLLYYFFSEDWRRTISKNILSGATVDRIPIAKFPSFEISIPSLETQCKIAAVLSAYDDLIENNTRRIRILEEIAQAIYREWFVNFRFPGHEGVRLVDSELGSIPEGWEVKRLADIADVNQASIRKGEQPGEIRYINISGVSKGHIEEMETLPFQKAPGRARRKVKHGDVIWSAVRPNLRAYALILNPADNLIVSTGFAVISPRVVSYSYLYQALTSDDFVGYLVNHVRGAAYPAVNTEDFENAKVLVPDADLLQAYHLIAEDLFVQRQNLLEKNVNLRQTRDLLLPRLISRVVNVEDLDIDTRWLEDREDNPSVVPSG